MNGEKLRQLAHNDWTLTDTVCLASQRPATFEGWISREGMGKGMGGKWKGWGGRPWVCWLGGGTPNVGWTFACLRGTRRLSNTCQFVRWNDPS